MGRCVGGRRRGLTARRALCRGFPGTGTAPAFGSWCCSSEELLEFLAAFLFSAGGVSRSLRLLIKSESGNSLGVIQPSCCGSCPHVSSTFPIELVGRLIKGQQAASPDSLRFANLGAWGAAV